MLNRESLELCLRIAERGNAICPCLAGQLLPLSQRLPFIGQVYLQYQNQELRKYLSQIIKIATLAGRGVNLFLLFMHRDKTELSPRS